MKNITYYSPTQTKKVQDSIQDWLNNQMFSHFMTIRLPLGAYTDNFDKAKPIFHKIIRHFEKSLVGRHWNRNPVHFVGTAELGTHKIWHLHLLLGAQKYTNEEIQNALDKVIKKLKLTERTIDLQEIDRTPDILNSYLTKEITADNLGHFDTDKVIFSEIEFNLPAFRR